MKINRGFILIFCLIAYIITISIAFGRVLNFFNLNLSLMWLFIISQTLSFLVPFLFYLLITKQNIKNVLHLKMLSLNQILLTITITFLSLPIAFFLSALAGMFSPNQVADIMITASAVYSFPLMIFAVAVTPSILEEIVFRGAIYKEFESFPIFYSSILNGFFFGLIHMNFQQFFYAFALGIVFSYMVYYSRSILAPILAHFIINGLNVSLVFIASQLILLENHYLYYAIDQIDYQDVNLWSVVLILGIISLFCLPIIVFLLRKLKEKTPDDI